MKTTVIYTAAFFILCLTGMKCEKTNSEPEVETLPAETQSGKGTFGCLVDGKVWLPKGKSFISGISTIIQFNILSIGTIRGKESIGIAVRDLNQMGDNVLMGDNSASYSIDGISFKATEGSVTITKYDKVNKIISGRFWFKGKNENGETVDIENGRFDVKYTD